jgi:hypothetical protein
MRARNALVRPLRRETVTPDGIRMLPFPEHARTEREILYGIDDRHLDLRVLVPGR